MEFDFEENDIKCLKHLKIVFDAFNGNYVSGKYGVYIPVGLLAIHTVTLCNKYSIESFEGEEELYFNYVNAEYIKMSAMIGYLIMNSKITLIDQRYDIPLPNQDLRTIVSGLLAGERNDYLTILSRHIALDEYIQNMKLLDGVSVEDPRILAAIDLFMDSKNNDAPLRKRLKSNFVLYDSVSQFSVKTESKPRLNTQQKREVVLKNFIQDVLKMKAPVDMRDTSYGRREDLWSRLHDEDSELFLIDGDRTQTMNRFFNKQLLCAFDDKRLLKISQTIVN